VEHILSQVYEQSNNPHNHPKVTNQNYFIHHVQRNTIAFVETEGYTKVKSTCHWIALEV